MKAAIAALAAVLAGCASEPVVQVQKVPYEVKVPVYTERKPPDELSRGYTPVQLPKFLAPTDPKAVVSLDKAGLDSLKVLLRTLKTRDNAWRKWANGE